MTTSTTKTTRKPRKAAAQAPAVEAAPRVSKTPCYELPAVRGIQSGREYFTSMIPLRLLKKLFIFEQEEMPAEMRAQRDLNPRRAKAIANYVLTSEPYVLSAITVTIDVPAEDSPDFCFKPMGSQTNDTGHLQVPMSAQFLIADGQHRTAGLKQALQENPDLADETIPVVLFLHASLKSAQQMFHDLNHFAAKPTKSLNLLYDHRTEGANLTREVMKGVPVFRQFTDTERTSLMKNSIKLFTLNGLAEANEVLLHNLHQPYEEQVKLAIAYWQAVTEEMPDWEAILQKRRNPGEVRQELLSCHAITLVALGCLGNWLLRHRPDDWQVELKAIDLTGVDWSKTNSEWRELIIFGGCIRKNKTTALALAKYLESRTKLTQAELEDRFSGWLKTRHHPDTLANLVQAPDWEEDTKQEAISEITGRFDAQAVDVAWKRATSYYRLQGQKQPPAETVPEDLIGQETQE